VKVSKCRFGNGGEFLFQERLYQRVSEKMSSGEIRKVRPKRIKEVKEFRANFGRRFDR
jgi:hypothetical protein